MSKQWQATTGGGHEYRITGRDPDSVYPIRGEVYDSGFTVRCDWNKDGRISPGSESQYDLIPVEPEASPAKVRVDLALAAMAYKLARDQMRAAMERELDARLKFREAMKACEKDNALVSINGELFLFQADEEGCIFVEQTEVL
jgi:hypothetical protein